MQMRAHAHARNTCTRAHTHAVPTHTHTHTRAHTHTCCTHAQASSTCVLPRELELCCQEFNAYYLQHHSGRKLTWQVRGISPLPRCAQWRCGQECAFRPRVCAGWSAQHCKTPRIIRAGILEWCAFTLAYASCASGT